MSLKTVPSLITGDLPLVQDEHEYHNPAADSTCTIPDRSASCNDCTAEATLSEESTIKRLDRLIDWPGHAHLLSLANESSTVHSADHDSYSTRLQRK